MQEPNILTVQSSVAFGHVGNSVATFPMQYRGINVSPLHTLQFSTEPLYKCGFSGSKSPDSDIKEILEKFSILSNELHQEHLLLQEHQGNSNGNANTTTTTNNNNNNNGKPKHETNSIPTNSTIKAGRTSLFSHILSGYIGTPDAVSSISDFISDEKTKRNPNLFFFCDPVCGDNGALYVSHTVADNIKEKLIPLSDAISPNGTEAEYFTGVSKIDSHEKAILAASRLHDMGPRLVVITSYHANDNNNNNSNNSSNDNDSNDTTTATINETKGYCLFSYLPPKTNSESTTTTTTTDSTEKKEEQSNHKIQNIFSFPVIQGHFAGTGDLLAALLLSEIAIRGEQQCIATAMLRSLKIVVDIVKDTAKHATIIGGMQELRLIANRRIFDLDSDCYYPELGKNNNNNNNNNINSNTKVKNGFSSSCEQEEVEIVTI